MKYFSQLQLPAYPALISDLTKLLDNSIVNWGPNKQICLNSIVGKSTDIALGTSSLDYDWDNASTVIEHGISRIIVPKKEVPLKDSDFTVLCDQFKNTEFENVYNMLNSNFKIGRVRLIKSEPKTCMSWHIDHSQRIHYPLCTQEGCLMVIKDEVMHLPQDTWWMTNTVELHTAFNSSKSSRIHLVVCLID